MLKGRKHCLNMHKSIFVIFLCTLKGYQVEKLCFSSIWNSEIVCYHIDTRWQVFSLSKCECLAEPIQMQLSQNLRLLAQFSLISVIYIKSWILWKRRWSLEVICFLNYRLQKAGLLKCLNSNVSEHLYVDSMLKVPKHCLNLHGTIFVISFDHSARKSALKIPFE